MGGVAPAATPAPAAKWYAGMAPAPEAAQLIDSKGWNNLNEVTKGYHELEKVVGAKGLPLPGEKAGDEEWTKFHHAIPGVPKAPTEYKIPLPAADYQQNDADKTYESGMRPAFHKAGLTQRQVDILTAEHNKQFGEMQKSIAGQAEAARAAGETELATLQKAWGADATKNVALAQTAAQTLYPKDSPEFAKLEKLMGAGAMVDHFYRVGLMMSEGGGVVKPGAQAGFGTMTPEQAKAAIDSFNAEIAANPKHPYFDDRHPEHRAANEKMMRFHTIAYPGSIKQD